VFEEQSTKWEPLVLSHTSRAIAVVHDYIHLLLTEVCQEKQVRDQLFDSLLLEKLRKVYCRAMNHARFLLRIEREGRPVTYNHYFNANLQKKRNERMCQSLKSMGVPSHPFDSNAKCIPLEALTKHAIDKENGQQIREDILDTLVSYYKVARKRFVDVICQHVVHHFLLDGEESPLKVFSPELVMTLKAEELDLIAGESPESGRQRYVLQQRIQNLEAALKVMRS
jgi:Dynamin GTPase effector domain